jgi:hypothetical protein
MHCTNRNIRETIPNVEGLEKLLDYQWLYGLKTKNEVKVVAQQWMAEIAELREKYPLLVVMRDNAGKINQ